MNAQNFARRILINLLLLCTISPLFAQNSYVNFEGKQTNPIRLSADGTRLYVVNTADGRLSVFDVTYPSNPSLLVEIPVGLEPVSVNPRTADEVWVVNEVSDSVSIVSVSRQVVVDTLYVQDEPADVVFAGGKAFVSAGRRNQIVVFDATNHMRLATIPVFGEDPRALAVSMDGTKVYAAFALSGNRTTQVPVLTAPAQPPPSNTNLPAPPQTSLIVNVADPAWTSVIKYRIPDNDVVEIDVASLSITRYFTNVGTINLALAVRPNTGDLYVGDTQAANLVRFEPNVRQQIVTNALTVINITSGVASSFNLNFSAPPTNSLPALTNALSIPTAIAFEPTGASFYVAAFGTDRVAHFNTANLNNVTRIEIGNAVGSMADPRFKRGPRALALNSAAHRLYVLNRISNTISIIDTTSDTVLKELPVGSYDPTPAVIRNGRGFLYDAKLSGNGNASCATCHVDGDNDLIAWDLGDPAGNMVTVTVTATNGQTFLRQQHPMKGPMMTQTLRGLGNNEPFHWRGDKTNFMDFNTTFNTLLGGAVMNDQDMNAFRDFINTLTFAPNPNQNLDRTYPPNFAGGNPQAGLTSFFTQPTSIGLCVSCHTPPPGVGSTNVIRMGLDDGVFQNFKVPHLRNLYQKASMTKAIGANSIAGFGFMHDGQEPNLVTFLSRPPFTALPPLVRTNLSAFLLCFDNGTAPAVGYSRTVTATNLSNSSISNDWSLLESQAAALNINLIVKGTLDGVRHGLLYQPGSADYQVDSTNIPPLTRLQLAAKVQSGDTLTLMGVPPGSGDRIALDRNSNGTLDADEPPPKLQITRSGQTIIISWPFSSGFVLESATDLSPNSWTAVDVPAEILNNQSIITLTLSSTPTFYRLHPL